MQSTIYLKAENGQWEVLGRDRFAGIWAEGLTMISNEHGPDTCSFTIKRSPDAEYPDLRSRVRCRIESGGEAVWSGFVWETPGTGGADGQLTVSGRGTQYKLDEDPQRYMAIQTDLGNFKDIRSLLAANLSIYKPEPSVEISSAGITMGWAKGAQIVTNDSAGAVLDLGDYYYIDAISFSLETSSVGTDIFFGCLAYDHGVASTSYGRVAQTLFTSTALNSINPGRATLTEQDPTEPVRYIKLVVTYTGAGTTPTTDHFIKIRRMAISARPHYWVSSRLSGSAAVLRASDIVYDVLDPVNDDRAVDGSGDTVPTAAAIVVQPPNSPKYSDEVLSTPEPMCAYSFEESAAPVLDYSGNAKLLSEVSTGTAISYAQAGTLDNSAGNEVSASAVVMNNGKGLQGQVASTRTKDVMFEFLFKTATLPQYGFVFVNGTTAARGISAAITNSASPGASGSQLVFLAGGVAWVTALATTLTANTWYHVIGGIDPAGNWKVYINGRPVAGSATSAVVAPNSTDKLTLGMTEGFANKAQNLTIDEFAAYNCYVGPDLAKLHYRAAVAKRTGSTIDRTLFNIDEFAPDSPVTKRERIEAANAFHDHLWRYDALDRFHYTARPDAPVLEMGSRPGAEFSDASMNSSEEVYNWVALTAPLANWSFDQVNPLAAMNPGDLITLDRHAVQLEGEGLDQTVATATIGNPSFATNTSGWSSDSGSTLTRDTTIYDSTPASMSVVHAASKPAHTKVQVDLDWNATAEGRGRTTCFVLRMCSYGPEPAYVKLSVQPYHYGGTKPTVHYAVLPPSPGWVTVYVPWTSDIGQDGVYLHIEGMTLGSDFRVDSLSYAEVTTTLLDRLKEVRRKELKVDSMLTIAALNKLADVFLTHHKDPPLKGSITVTETGGVRLLVGGAPVPPAQLLNYVGQKILISDQVDPVTGAIGRVGTIVSVEVSDDEDKAVIALDNSRTSFEALLSRVALVTGQYR